MNDTAMIVGAILLGICVAVAVISLVIRATNKSLRLAPRVSHGPDGRHAEIPISQTSAVLPSRPGVALVRRYAGVSMLRITPRGIEYRIMRWKRAPYASITHVDAPDPSKPRYFVVGVRGSLSVALLATSTEGADLALTELAQRAHLTQRAWQRIAHLYPDGPRH